MPAAASSGYGTQFDEDNFFRDAGQVAYNLTLSGMGLRHNIHAGFQMYVDSEDLKRSSNGWGLITVPGGAVSFQGTPIFYQAEFQSQGIGTLPKIHSEYHSKSFEINDTATWNNWTYQRGPAREQRHALRPGSPECVQHAVGIRACDGDDVGRAEVQDVQHSLQQDAPAAPEYRPGRTTSKDTVFASYARYNPAASSLPRAASWDRNLAATQRANFDATGRLFAVDTVASSSGKLFVPDMTPRRYDEWLFGTAKQFNPDLVGTRVLPLHARHRISGRTRTTRRAKTTIPRRRCPAPTPGSLRNRTSRT